LSAGKFHCRQSLFGVFINVVILQDVADVSKARSWLASDDMKAAMRKSGVIGTPTIRFAA
jgi:hypothetical protein